jgi:anti-sigma-K factor RskA
MTPRDPQEEYDDGDERLLAAEFVLGLVQGDARADLARRVASDPVFAGHVAFWEARLGPIAEDVAPVDVPPHVWEKISQELGRVVTAPRAAPVPAAKPGLWNSLPFWRGLSLATTSLAAAGIAAVMLAPKPPVAPAMVAMLSLDDGRSGFMASVDRGTGRMMLMPALQSDAPADHVHELWLIPSDGTPRSLGTFEAKGPVAMAMPADLSHRMVPDGVLAISVEPMGGSPTGLPTGPVVAKGKMHNI